MTKVNHNVSPNKVETTLKGTRQPMVIAPIVKDPISILDLVLSEQDGEGSDGTFDLDEGRTTGSSVVDLPTGSNSGGNPLKLGDYNN